MRIYLGELGRFCFCVGWNICDDSCAGQTVYFSVKTCIFCSFSHYLTPRSRSTVALEAWRLGGGSGAEMSLRTSRCVMVVVQFSPRFRSLANSVVMCATMGVPRAQRKVPNVPVRELDLPRRGNLWQEVETQPRLVGRRGQEGWWLIARRPGAMKESCFSCVMGCPFHTGSAHVVVAESRRFSMATYVTDRGDFFLYSFCAL